MFEEGANCVWVAENKSECGFWVAKFEDFVEFVPGVKAEKSEIWKRDVMKGRFF